MPIYEYRCCGCSDEFETIQKFSDAPLSRCEKCGGRLEKLLSRSAFALKGAGWYADGYGRKSSSSKSGDKAPASSSSSSSTSSGDASSSTAKAPGKPAASD